jgi:bacterioferritin-associated ferredoxin
VRGPPPVRADGGALTHGKLRSQRAPATMPRTRSQRLRETMEEDGWAGMPEELFEKVLESLQPDGPSKPQDGGLGFSQALAAVRLVCAAWKTVHDAMVTRLVLSPQTTDEAVGKLVRRFPTVVSLEVKGEYGVAVLTDQGLRAVSSLASLTFLDLSWCLNVTDEGVRAVVSSCTALKTLNLFACDAVTDEGVRAVSSLPALTFLDLADSKVTDEGVRAVASSCTALKTLNLCHCLEVTDEGVKAVSSCNALTSLSLDSCYAVTDVGVRALSSLPALASLDLRACGRVTAAGVQALRSTTAAPSLHIIEF